MHRLLNRNQSQFWTFSRLYKAIKFICWSFWALSQTQMIDFLSGGASPYWPWWGVPPASGRQPLALFSLRPLLSLPHWFIKSNWNVPFQIKKHNSRAKKTNNKYNYKVSWKLRGRAVSSMGLNDSVPGTNWPVTTETNNRGQKGQRRQCRLKKRLLWK